MKKFLASVLCLTLVMSFAACSSTKEPEQTSEITTTTTTTEATTTETSETTTESKAEETSETSIEKKTNPAFAYIQDKVEKHKIPESWLDEEDDELEFHIPYLLIESSYADEVNKEISGKVAKYMKDLDSQDAGLFTGTGYAAFLTKEDVLSLVFVSYHEWDCNEYKVYNIDVKTGDKVDNARIAQIAGVSSIRQAAMDALQKFYNDREWVKLDNYKVVLEPGRKKDDQMKNVESSFGEKYLNDNMQIGLTEEGKMFFITTAGSMGGADFYEYVFDVEGFDLDTEANKFVPFDDGGEEEEDDSFDEEA